MLIWDMLCLGHRVYQIRLCSRFDLGYPKLDSEHKSCFGHGYSQIEKFDLGSPKSKCRFGNVPNQIRNKSEFGLQQYYHFDIILILYQHRYNTEIIMKTTSKQHQL